MYSHRVFRLRQVAVVVGIALASVGLARAAAPMVRFGVPPWPGVAVKTEIVEQLLTTLGYQTRTQQVGLAFIYRGLAGGHLDAFMGAWLPAQKSMLAPLVKKHRVVVLGSNLSGAVEGLAVPDYVWKKGIHSVADLAAHPAMFNHKIYGIESGSAMDQAISKAIAHNYEGLRGYHLVPSSTAAMLAQLDHVAPHKKAMVFLGWRPHWMNIKFHIRYLRDKKGSPIADIDSDVKTLVSAKFGDRNVRTLLRNVHVSAHTQSRWIYAYSYKKQPLAKVARHWLAAHPGTVGHWLKGVHTAGGQSGMAAYRKAFGN